MWDYFKVIAKINCHIKVLRCLSNHLQDLPKGFLEVISQLFKLNMSQNSYAQRKNNLFVFFPET